MTFIESVDRSLLLEDCDCYLPVRSVQASDAGHAVIVFADGMSSVSVRIGGIEEAENVAMVANKVVGWLKLQERIKKVEVDGA